MGDWIYNFAVIHVDPIIAKGHPRCQPETDAWNRFLGVLVVVFYLGEGGVGGGRGDKNKKWVAR